LILAAAAAAPLASCVPACVPDAGPAPAPVEVPVPGARWDHWDPADDCTTEHGWMVGGRLVVTVLHDTEQFPCDLVGGQQLNLVWNSETEGEGWGGDASVEAAADACDDAGGRQFWVNDGDYRLVCEDVDF
jgi:hypothetical protein